MKTMNGMTEFQRLQLVDVIEPVRHLIENGTIKITREHKLRPNERILPSPWIRSVRETERCCTLWTMWFNTYRFIPSGCRQCWKATFSPLSLKEVYEVEELQKELEIPSKVGMENRSWTGNQGGYSAFWYCPLGCGLHRARGLHTRIKNELTMKLKHSVDVILKRGCTEFERIMGPSDTWDQLASERGWDEKERIIATVWEPQVLVEIPEMLNINTKLRMIYFAHEHGDMTYKEFVGQEQLPPLTRYEKSIHSDKDFPPEGKNGINITGHEDADNREETSPKLTIV